MAKPHALEPLNSSHFFPEKPIIGEPDFKVGDVWGGPSDGKAYQRAIGACRP